MSELAAIGKHSASAKADSERQRGVPMATHADASRG